MAAVGSVAITTADVGGGITKVTLAWTCSAGGAVSGNPFDAPKGFVKQAKFVPGTPTPTDLYDVTLVDTDGADLLGGVGADRLAAAASLHAPHISTSGVPFNDGAQQLDLVVANAGATKQGTVILWIGR